MPVMPRHSIVQIGLIRREQFNQRPVFEQDALNERLGLGDQIPFQLVVEARVDLLIRLDSVDDRPGQATSSQSWWQGSRLADLQACA